MKYLLSSSASLLIAAGVAWACGGGYEEDPSVFAPEYFVDPQFSPFFFESSHRFYSSDNLYENNAEDNNRRFNEETTSDWHSYLGNSIARGDLETLLFTLSSAGVDSVDQLRLGKLRNLPSNYPNLPGPKFRKKKIDQFFEYLRLAKEAESYAVNEADYWYEPAPKKPVDGKIESRIKTAFQTAKDPFLKQRYWFQLVRYYFYADMASESSAYPVEAAFNSYINSTKNSLYYRSLSYLAGHYYHQKKYAEANYLYSLCYDHSFKMKIPSAWSFHPQEEQDWKQTLALAKNKEEEVTLWHLLGMEHDPVRAIKEIAKRDPKSEKMDLLLSRVVNITEYNGLDSSYSSGIINKKTVDNDLHSIDSITRSASTNKPWFWNLASGYLHFLKKDYRNASAFYDRAEKVIPVKDTLVNAQYKLLKTLLFVSQLKKIDATTEAALVEPLNWLADLRDQKRQFKDLRYADAMLPVTSSIANLYKSQKDVVKAVCFEDVKAFYTNNSNINALESIFLKKNRTAFENVMLRYYPHKLEDLYYHQACMLTYQEKIDEAIALMEKSGEKGAKFELAGNPFNSRLNDCHDCDHEAPQKLKFTPLSFLKAIKAAKDELNSGNNSFRNSFLLANAYYNMTYYGNARLFYQTDITGYSDYNEEATAAEFRKTFTNQDVCLKYYLRARQFAQTDEQRARCTFMASKCERNQYYNQVNNKSYSDDYSYFPGGKYFAELKQRFLNTKYYQEILKECGYFRSYVKP
ncbi:hypothetical protein [Desertivirga brevis]|uniref:hypothetical protein n=1 Tax=Desertivirga brevis TaxID=2810310 RepID=UPI001A958D42|nr:hypothetical protein [Pedobacter sp. SYSU D00873]